MVWVPPSGDVLKFDVARDARGKPGPAGIRGVLRDGQWVVFIMFSKNVGIMGSNKVEVVAILEPFISLF